MVAPRNIVTNPIKVGRVGKQTSLGGVIRHMGDDYDAGKKLAQKEREYHMSKLQDKPFSQQCRRLRNGVFNSHKTVFDIKEDIKALPRTMTAPRRAEHDKPFRPSNPPKKGYNKSIARFPNYMENPPKELTRVRPVDGEEQPPRFKMTTNFLSRPTPSVATNMKNLRTSFPSVFRR